MTNEEIIQRGQLINDETEPAQNTSERVGGVIKGIGQNLADKDTAIAAEAARNGYYQCTVSGTTLAVTAPGFTLPAHGGNIRIKMSAPATGACTLNINSTGAKTLLYNGAALSSANTWEKDEIISVFYDPSGSGQYLASNSQGGGGKAEKIKYDNSQSGLAANNVQEAVDEVSSNIPLLVTNGNDEDDLDIADFVGNILAKFKDGHLETKECSWVIDTTADGLLVADSNGNILAWLIGGQLIMGGFNSTDIGGTTKEDYYDIVKPTSAIKIYNTCNDIDKTTNKWGINSRNYGLSVFLDHFIKPSTEKTAKFDKNGKTFVNLSQKIVGQTTTWNNGVTSYEESKNYDLNDSSDEITIINRQILNSATSSLFPKILQIGDSVTQAWFANYPTIASAPTASWSWAKYFFEKDKLQKGSGFDSLLIGTYTSVNVNYDGTQFKAWAEGRGGWTPQNYWSSSSNGGVSNPFYDSSLQHFSLQSYLNKYKTLADDGVTRLVVGSTAGTSVTNVNAYDVCTPNVVVLQLGMNGTLAIWQTYMVNIIQQIKSEFPNMKIIISCLDAALCMFPSLYPEYDDISLTDYDGAHARMIDIMKWAIDTLPTQTYTANGSTYYMTEANGIYVIYTGAIMPMPYSCNVREIVNPLSTLQEGLRRYVGVDAIERVKHPSRFAHAAIGYELYSAIKWVLMN